MLIKIRLFWIDFIFLYFQRQYNLLLHLPRTYHFPLSRPLYTTVMVNFMFQLEWAMECPKIWFSIILGLSVRKMFLGEINVWTSRLSKVPSLMWVGLIPSVEDLNKTNRLSEEESTLSTWLFLILFFKNILFVYF